MRILALGSCRIHEPLIAAEQSGTIEYLNRLFERRISIYLHDVLEVIQFVRLVRGEITMPAGIRPFAYERGLRLHRRMIVALKQAEHVVVESCTDKHYEAAGWTLNVNEIHRLLVSEAGTAAGEWWRTIDRREPPSEALCQSVEAELRARWRMRWRFGDGHRLVLRNLTLRYLSVSEIADGLEYLQALLAKPLLIVPHVVVRLADGSHLAERLRHVEKTVAAARMLGLQVLDPRTFVERDGQHRALAEGGINFHHYADNYMPVVGQEIVDALRGNVGQTSADRASIRS